MCFLNSFKDFENPLVKFSIMTFFIIFRKRFFIFQKNKNFRSKKRVEKIFDSLYRCKIFRRIHFSIASGAAETIGDRTVLHKVKIHVLTLASPWNQLHLRNSDLHCELELQNTKTYNFFQKQFFDV